MLATWPQRLRTSSSTVCARGAFRLISTAMTPNSRICSTWCRVGMLHFWWTALIESSVSRAQRKANALRQGARGQNSIQHCAKPCETT